MLGDLHVRFAGGRPEKEPRGHLASRRPYTAPLRFGERARLSDARPDALSDRRAPAPLRGDEPVGLSGCCEVEWRRFLERATPGSRRGPLGSPGHVYHNERVPHSGGPAADLPGGEVAGPSGRLARGQSAQAPCYEGVTKVFVPSS